MRIPADARDSPRRTSILMASLVIVVSICVAYSQSLKGVLLLDDGPAITGNATLRHVWPLSGALSPPAGTTLAVRPIANLSFAINHALTGDTVRGYHAGNLLIHIGCALLLFGTLRRTLLKSFGAGALGRDSLPVALAVALLWGVHPLTTEAVTYVVQRVESLAAFLLLGALYSFMRAATGQRPTAWLALSSFAAFLAAGAKEVGAVVPLIILLYDALFVSGSATEAIRSRRSYYLSLAAGWLLLLGLEAHSGWTRADSAGFGSRIPPSAYWLTQTEALCRYLWLSLWPHPLVFDYGPYLASGPRVALALPVVIALLTLTAVALVKRNPLGYAGAWFFLILAPTSLVPVATQTMAEHRAYLPLAAVVLCGVLVLHRMSGGGWKFGLPVACLAAVLCTATWARNLDYESSIGLWTATVRDWPQNPRAHCSLGDALTHSPGEMPRAMSEFREALRLNGSYADAHTDLGVALEQDPSGLDEAISQFRESLRIRPGSAETHNDLGTALAQAGNVADAKAEFEEAIRVRPEFPDAECNMGILMLRTGDIPSAEEHLEKSVEIDPENARADFFLGDALAQAGKPGEAVAKLREVIRLRPDFAEAHSTLGMMLFRTGSPIIGMAELDTAIRLQPNLIQAHMLRAAGLIQQGNAEDASRELHRVLKLDPENSAALRMLESLGTPAP